MQYDGYALSLLLIFLCKFDSTLGVQPSPTGNSYYDGKVTTVPISADAGLELYQRWMEQAYSSLFASIANQKLKTAAPRTKDELAKCSKNAQNVIAHAKCVVKLISSKNVTNGLNRRLNKYKKNSQNQRINWVGNFGIDSTKPAIKTKRDTTAVIVNRSQQPQLLSEYQGISPLGAVAKILTKGIVESKNKTSNTSWQTTIDKIRKFMLKKREKKLNKSKNQKLQQNNEIFMDDSLAFRGIKKSELENLDEQIEDPKKLKNFLKQQNNKESTNPKEKFAHKLSKLLREGVKLGYTLSGQNTTDLDEKTMKVISPRFLSVLPEETNKDTVIIFNIKLLHDEGQGLENLTSLPTLMNLNSSDVSKNDVFGSKDQQEWLNLIMEFAGINEQAELLEKEEIDNDKWANAKKQYDKEIRGKDGQPLYFTKQNVTEMYGDLEKRKIETYEYLYSTFSSKQLSEMNRTGYATMNKTQLKILYGPDSPYNSSEALARLMPLTHSQIQHEMINDINRTASMKSFKLRQKDVVLSPLVFTPFVLTYPSLNQAIVLSPVVFSPVILTPAVLGPFILSPWLFIPVKLECVFINF